VELLARESGRTRAGRDHVHIESVERLQLTVYPNTAEHSTDDGTGAAIESIRLHFAGSDWPAAGRAPASPEAHPAVIHMHKVRFR
jgi:hypothetical protein